MKNILIKNGRLVDPASGIDKKADILISKKKVVEIKSVNRIKVDAATKVIDAKGLTVIPGLVDTCARMREPGLEYKATLNSELIAAAKSGITTLCCPPDTDPTIDEPAVVELINQTSADAKHSKVVTLGALTARLRGERLSEMVALKQAGCVGLSNCRKPIENLLILKRAFAYAATFDMPVFVEPDQPCLSEGGCAHEGKIATRLGLKGIPVSAETIAITTALELAMETGTRLHIGRLSSAQGAEMIARAKNEHLPVTADVSAHQLHLTEHDISNFNTACHVIPPLRTERDREALIRALADGTIDAICSDHQPHNIDAKAAPFASTEPGISALETLLPLSLRLKEQSSMTLPDVIEKITSAPAAILSTNTGSLAVGDIADVCIIDETEEWELSDDTLHSQGKNTPFMGWNFQARVKYTIVDGSLVYKA